jgi:hypothetical protein
MKKTLTIIVTALVFLVSGSASADLDIIGTATDSAGSYNMVWENHTDGTSLVWLDMTTSNTWQDAMTWAAGLDSTMTYDVDSDYTVAFTDGQWRLPEVEDRVTSTDSIPGGIGYNIPGEASHLFHSGGFANTGPFENLNTTYIGNWLATTSDYPMTTNEIFLSPDNAPGAYYYNLGNDNLLFQRLDTRFGNPSKYTLAVRSADVTPVPVPGAFLLGSMGLGFATWRLKRRRTA